MNSVFHKFYGKLFNIIDIEGFTTDLTDKGTPLIILAKTHSVTGHPTYDLYESKVNLRDIKLALITGYNLASNKLYIHPDDEIAQAEFNIMKKVIEL